MNTHEARRRVIDHYESAGMVVYERRHRDGFPAMGQIVVVDPGTGLPQLVRILVGSRPRRSKRLTITRGRVGLCEMVALVDPRDGSVNLTPALTAREQATTVQTDKEKSCP